MEYDWTQAPGSAKRIAIMNAPNSFRTLPDDHGHFGQFGGRYVAETLMPLILELEKHFRPDQGLRSAVCGKK